jgi:hypothetical protein
VRPHRTLAQQRGDIDRDIRLFEALEHAADVHLGGAAVSQDQRGHTHAGEVAGRRQREDVFRVRVNVDEPRRDDQAADIDDLRGIDARPADAHDPAVLDRHIGKARGVTGPVDDPATRQHEIKFLRRRGKQPRSKR